MKAQQKTVWDYLQISRRRCSKRNFVRAIWSRYNYPSNPFPKHHKNHKHWVRKWTNTIERGRLYHKTIAVIFASRLLQNGNDQWPHTNDVGHKVRNMRQTQIICQNGLFHSLEKRHPISRLSASQPTYNELIHCNPVQTNEHIGSCPLQTTFEQAKIKIRVVNKLLTVPTTQILAEGFHEKGWSAADWSHWHVRPQCIYYSTKCWNFLMMIATLTIQSCHAISRKNVSTPGAEKDPHHFALFVELHAAAPVWFCPSDATRQNSEIHHIEKDGQKHA